MDAMVGFQVKGRVKVRVVIMVMAGPASEVRSDPLSASKGSVYIKN